MSDAEACPDVYDATSVPALWDAARWFFRWLTGLCESPCALVAQPWLSRKQRRDILHWLRPVEALVRRLLVVEAVRIAETLPPATKNASEKAKRPAGAPFCRVSFPDPEQSSAWTVRFSVIPLARKRASRPLPRLQFLDTDNLANVLASAALAAAAEEHRARMRSTEEIPAVARARRLKPSRRAGNPWPLARRIEALSRVINNPQPYARRLARLLRKDPDVLFTACKPPPVPPPGEPFRPAETCLRQASEHALEALGRFSVFRDQ